MVFCSSSLHIMQTSSTKYSLFQPYIITNTVSESVSFHTRPKLNCSCFFLCYKGEGMAMTVRICTWHIVTCSW
uniref:Uncharacterized protein n=1 Tax=Octopus bimaculoides TaxID=37653 RepID=A0A0L8FW25_OCTBM